MKYNFNFNIIRYNNLENNFKNNFKNNAKKKHKQNLINNPKTITYKKNYGEKTSIYPLHMYFSEEQKSILNL